jgi:hypothetical protein
VGWLILGVWLGAVVLAAVVLGFCAYELRWRSKRLAGDLDRLSELSATLAGLQDDVRIASRRLTDASS